MSKVWIEAALNGAWGRERQPTIPISVEEIVADGISEDRVMEVDLGDARNRAQNQVLDARLGGGGHGDRVAVTTQPGGDPEDVDGGDRGRRLGLAAVGNCALFHRKLSR